MSGPYRTILLERNKDSQLLEFYNIVPEKNEIIVLNRFKHYTLRVLDHIGKVVKEIDLAEIIQNAPDLREK